MDKVNKWVVLILVSLVVLGGILRFNQLGNQSYWMDEGYTVNAILSILEHGSTILDSGQNYSCPTYCYPTTYLVRLLGNDPYSYRLLSVLAGLLFIIAIFFITRTLFNQKIALLSSFFTTFSYWQIAWSRQARWYTLFSIFFWLALFFFYQSLYSSKNRYLNITLTTIFTILSVVTHGLGYLLPIIFVGWVLIDQILIQKKFNWSQSLVVVIGGAIILWLVNLTGNIDIIDYLLNSFQIHYVLPYYLSFYLYNYWLFITLGLVAFFNQDNPYKKQIYFLLFVLGVYFVHLSLFKDIVHYRYLFHLTPIFLLLGSIGLLNLQGDIKPRWGKIILWVVVIGLFAAIAGGSFLPKTYYYLEADSPYNLSPRPYNGQTPQPNWASAYAFIKDNKKVGDLIISSHPHFNKIFLGEAGYWIKYNYLPFETISRF